MSARRTKWHPPPPQTPKILHFPRRSMLFRPAKHRVIKSPAVRKPNLEALMRQESLRFVEEEERRAKVEESYSSISGEITRDSAEVALRELERNRVYFMEKNQRMISGRKKIDGNAAIALNEEIEKTLEKQDNIHRGFKWRKEKVRRSVANFDRRLEMMEEETSAKEITEVSDEIAKHAFSSKEDNVSTTLLSSNRKCTFPHVEKLRVKMEGLSKGMLERVAEHGRGSERHRLFGMEVGAEADRSLHLRQTKEFRAAKQLDNKGARSCCNCKNLVDKIAEQVRAEAEQCAEMQAMLDKVKTDMEELRSSRDRWQRRAISSELELRSLRALELQKTAKDLRKAEASSLKTSADQLDSEICRLKQLKIREKQKMSSAVKEKHVVVCQRRSPLQEIGNLPIKDSAARMFR